MCVFFLLQHEQPYQTTNSVKNKKLVRSASFDAHYYMVFKSVLKEETGDTKIGVIHIIQSAKF